MILLCNLRRFYHAFHGATNAGAMYLRHRELTVSLTTSGGTQWTSSCSMTSKSSVEW